jgi:Tol biopolymer transport system component
MKNSLLLLFFYAMPLMLPAGELVVQPAVKQSFSGSGGYFYPKFSHDGSFLLVSSANYAGIKQVNLQRQEVRELSNDPGAGYAMQVSSDGTTILYTKIELINQLRHNSLRSLSVSSGEIKQLSSPARDAIAPAFVADRPVYVKSRKLQRNGVSTSELKPILTIEDRKIVIYTGAGRKVLDPLGADASYIWPSLSPDGKLLVFTAAGRGTYVSTVEGKNPVALGKLNAPVWLDENWVIGMNDRDEGGRVVESTLWAVSTDGKIRRQLITPTGVIAMYPAVSADRSTIAFNSDRGEIYLMNILTH